MTEWSATSVGVKPRVSFWRAMAYSSQGYHWCDQGKSGDNGLSERSGFQTECCSGVPLVHGDKTKGICTKTNIKSNPFFIVTTLRALATFSLVANLLFLLLKLHGRLLILSPPPTHRYQFEHNVCKPKGHGSSRPDSNPISFI